MRGLGAQFGSLVLEALVALMITSFLVMSITKLNWGFLRQFRYGREQLRTLHESDWDAASIDSSCQSAAASSGLRIIRCRQQTPRGQARDLLGVIP